MNNTSIIAGATVLAFFVWIVTRGELPQYRAVFGL